MCDLRDQQMVETASTPVNFHYRVLDTQCCLDIAHAGGEVNSTPYTNSLEALVENYAAGRRVFEIDFSLTSDRRLILLHDWNSFGGTSQNYNVVFESAKNINWTVLDLNMFVEWVVRHPDALVITDTKFADGPEILLKALEERLSPKEIGNQFIFQLYSIEETKNSAPAQRGYPTLLTIYRMRSDSDQELSAQFSDVDIQALTMPLDRAQSSLSYFRSKYPDLPLYVHGSPRDINNPSTHACLQAKGASGFYLE